MKAQELWPPNEFRVNKNTRLVLEAGGPGFPGSHIAGSAWPAPRTPTNQAAASGRLVCWVRPAGQGATTTPAGTDRGRPWAALPDARKPRISAQGNRRLADAVWQPGAGRRSMPAAAPSVARHPLLARRPNGPAHARHAPVPAQPGSSRGRRSGRYAAAWRRSMTGLVGVVRQESLRGRCT